MSFFVVGFRFTEFEGGERELVDLGFWQIKERERNKIKIFFLSF